MKKLRSFETAHKSAIDEKFHQLNLGNIGQVLYWQKFFELVAAVPGDIVECGVGRGRSLLILAALNYLLDKAEGGARVIWGYDSFEGFPEPTAEDHSSRKPRKGEWAASPSGKYRYSPEFTKTVLEEAGIPLGEEDVRLVKGFFSETLKDHPARPIALLHVDADLYRSYKDVLTHLYPKVTRGGVIVFDDFHQKTDDEPFPGARQAVREYFGNDLKRLQMSAGGTYYLVKE